MLTDRAPQSCAQSGIASSLCWRLDSSACLKRHLRLYRREFEMGPILSINNAATKPLRPSNTPSYRVRSCWIAVLSLSARTSSALTSHKLLAAQRSGFPDRYEVRWNSGRVSKLLRFRHVQLFCARVITTFPLACPSLIYRRASATSCNG